MPDPSSPRRLCLVTGASAGIGAALARVAAARGYDLILTARRAERLGALAEEIRSRHGADVQAIAADLADPAAPERIISEIAARGRPVSALVNNAGFGLTGRYLSRSWAEQAGSIQVMLTAVCDLTYRVLPGMTGQRFGRILNVASVAGLIPASPGQTLYTPIKAFVVRFSESLHLETAGTGVHVTALCPGLTTTEFHDVNGTRAKVERRAPRWMWMTAEEVAEAGWRAVETNLPVWIPGWPNQAIAALARLLPEDWALSLTARTYNRAEM